MDYNYKIKLLIRFLKKHKAYHKFMKNALSLNGFETRKLYCEGKTLNEHIDYELKYNNGENIFNFSFQWDKTEDGDDFWYDIYIKWDNIIRCKIKNIK
jgi:hypothetical protein